MGVFMQRLGLLMMQVASGSPTYRYLRIIINTSESWTDGSIYPGSCRFSGLEFRATEGGAALTGTLSASFTQTPSTLANLTDSDTATEWWSGNNSIYRSGVTMGHDVTLDLGAGNEAPCAEVKITASNGSATRRSAPRVFTILGSNDNVNYDVLWFQPAEATWSAAEARLFTPSTGIQVMQIIRTRMIGATTSGALACAWLEFREVASGSKITGEPFCRKVIAGTTYPPIKFDDASSSTFSTNGGDDIGEYVGYALPNDNTMVEMFYEVRADSFREDPRNMRIERSLDGGMNFTTIKNFTSVPAWSAGEERTFDLT